MTDTQSSLLLPAPKTAAKLRSRWPVWTTIGLLFVIIFIGAGYFWLLLEKQSRQINHALNIESDLEQRLTQLQNTHARQLTVLEQQLASDTTLLGSLDKQVVFNTEQLNQLRGSSRADWLLGEAEYLLRLANQRLTMERDVRGAEAMLVAADQVLAENVDPGLYPVRQQLAKEILALQSVASQDIEGLYVQLEALIAALDQLNPNSFLTTPTAQPEPTQQSPVDEQQPVSTWTALWREIWSELKKVVVITKLDQPIEPLLTPEQSYYLKQNLRLMLEQASLALLDSEQVVFRNSLEKAERWLSTYFVPTEPSVRSLRTAIQTLKNVEFAPPPPDISGSLRLLKSRIEALYRSHQLDQVTSKAEQLQEPTQ